MTIFTSTINARVYIDPGHWPNDLSVHKWSWRAGFDPRSCHTKNQKMVLDFTLLNIQHYKVRIQGKVEQSREPSSALSYTSV